MPDTLETRTSHESTNSELNKPSNSRANLAKSSEPNWEAASQSGSSASSQRHELSLRQQLTQLEKSQQDVQQKINALISNEISTDTEAHEHATLLFEQGELTKSIERLENQIKQKEDNINKKRTSPRWTMR